MAAEELEPLSGGSSILSRAEGLFGGSGSRPKNWMAAAYGGAVAFCGRMLGARRVPDAFWTGRCPDATGTVQMSSSH